MLAGTLVPCRFYLHNWKLKMGGVGWKTRSAECGVWKMRSMENAECGKRGVWKMRSVEKAKYGKCRVWKTRSVENEEYGKCGVCGNALTYKIAS